jgi:hypothetical protein
MVVVLLILLYILLVLVFLKLEMTFLSSLRLHMNLHLGLQQLNRIETPIMVMVLHPLEILLVLYNKLLIVALFYEAS